MGQSFQEKSLWLMSASLIAAFGFYFQHALDSHATLMKEVPEAAVNVMPPQVALFVLAVILLVILSIVGHLVLVIVDRRTETDERDRLIGLKGARNGSYALATGVFCSLCLAVVTKGNFVFTHVLLAFWVLAQLVEYGTQLIHYRRGS